MPRIKKNVKEINDIILDYLDYCDFKNLSIKTIKSYHQTLILFAKYLEEEKEITDINKVNKDIVKNILHLLKKEENINLETLKLFWMA